MGKTNVMPLLLLISIVLLLSSCKTNDTQPTENKSSSGFSKVIMVYIPDDNNNSKEIHIANITVNKGDLGIIVIQDVPEIQKLKSALEEIKDKEGLFLEYEDKQGDTYYLKRELISQTDSRYIFALEGELMLNYGFRANVR